MMTQLVVCLPHLQSRSNSTPSVSRLLPDIVPRVWIPVTVPETLRCSRYGPTAIQLSVASIMISNASQCKQHQ
jgi:hypothetical protein